jgi:hypothetical protein
VGAGEREAKERADKEGRGAGAGAGGGGDTGSGSLESVLETLRTCGEVDEAVLRAFVDGVAKALGAGAVYIAEKVAGKAGGDGGDGGDGGGGAGGSQLKYVAASAGHEWLLERTLRESEGGVTWKVWVMPEPPADAADGGDGGDGGDASKPPPPPPTLPTVHVANVLRNSEVHFHAIPRPGAYLATPLVYGTLLHENALPAVIPPPPAPGAGDGDGGGGDDGGAGDGDGADGSAPPKEPAKAAIPAGNTVQRSLAVCADTVGLNRPFTEAQIAALKAATEALQAALLRTEQAAYEAEFAEAQAALVSGDDKAAGAQAAESSALAGESAGRACRCTRHPAPCSHSPPHPPPLRAQLLTRRLRPRSTRWARARRRSTKPS